VTRDRRPRFALVPLALLGVLLAAPGLAGAQTGAASPVHNMQTASSLDPTPVPITVSRGALQLGGLQVGSWEAGTDELALGTLEGLSSPCRGLRVDGRGETQATVCPDGEGRDRLVLAQGGAVLRFDRDLVDDDVPAVSDDGVRVAVVTADDGGETLRVLDLQQTLELGITGLDRPRHPVLAGGGTAVACTATVDGRRHVVLVDLVAEEARVLSNGQKESGVAAIAANGRRVLFRGLGRPGDVLYLADVDRNTLHALSDAEGAPLAADLSQHGDRAAFVHRIGGAIGLFAADMNARKIVNLAGFFSPLRDVSASADGVRLAYSTPDGAVTVVDTEGRRMETVTEVSTGCQEATMTSDGRWLFALCDHEGRAGALIRRYPLPILE